jgi:FSR family fosmidomycin resistance protein-like MFS transporter
MKDPPVNLEPNGAAALANLISAQEPTAAQREVAIVVVTSLGHFLCHLAEIMFPCVIIAVIAEYTLAPDAATRLALPGYILFGLGAVPVGVLADAWSTRSIFAIYFGLMAVSGAAVMFAPTPELLLVALTSLGLAASIYHPAGLAMISLGIARRSRAMGINGVAGNLGIALAPLVAWWAITYLGNWRWAYALIAALAAGFGVIMMVMVRRGVFIDPRPCHLGLASSTERDGPVQHGRRSRFRRYLPLLLLLLVMMLGGLNYRCLVTALPTYLSGETAQSGQLIRGGLWLASFALIAGAVGQLLGGYLGERAGAQRVYFYMIGSLIVTAAVLGTLEGHPAAVLVASLLAVGLFAQQPLENALLAESTSTARRSLSYGWKFVLTFGVGAMGAQIVGVVWTETGSLAPVFWLISVSACLMLILLGLQRWRSEGREVLSRPQEFAESGIPIAR